MVIFVFSLLFLAVFLLTRSYRYLERYYATALYISLISVVYAIICTDFGMWLFPIWWIFTDQAFVLFQAVILFPATTILYLRYLPSSRWTAGLYFLFFVVLYAAMEWIMVKNSEIRYSHGWKFVWSVVIDALMFFMMWLHERSRILTWIITVVVIVVLIIGFDVPLLVV